MYLLSITTRQAEELKSNTTFISTEASRLSSPLNPFQVSLLYSRKQYSQTTLDKGKCTKTQKSAVHKKLINVVRQKFACSSLYPRPSCHTLNRCLFYRHILGNSETLADGQNSYKFDILQICSFHKDQTLLSLRSTPCFHSAYEIGRAHV